MGDCGATFACCLFPKDASRPGLPAFARGPAAQRVGAGIELTIVQGTDRGKRPLRETGKIQRASPQAEATAPPRAPSVAQAFLPVRLSPRRQTLMLAPRPSPSGGKQLSGEIVRQAAQPGLAVLPGAGRRISLNLKQSVPEQNSVIPGRRPPQPLICPHGKPVPNWPKSLHETRLLVPDRQERARFRNTLAHLAQRVPLPFRHDTRH